MIVKKAFAFTVVIATFIVFIALSAWAISIVTSSNSKTDSTKTEVSTAAEIISQLPVPKAEPLERKNGEEIEVQNVEVSTPKTIDEDESAEIQKEEVETSKTIDEKLPAEVQKEEALTPLTSIGNVPAEVPKEEASDPATIDGKLSADAVAGPDKAEVSTAVEAVPQANSPNTETLIPENVENIFEVQTEDSLVSNTVKEEEKSGTESKGEEDQSDIDEVEEELTTGYGGRREQECNRIIIFSKNPASDLRILHLLLTEPSASGSAPKIQITQLLMTLLKMAKEMKPNAKAKVTSTPEIEELKEQKPENLELALVVKQGQKAEIKTDLRPFMLSEMILDSSLGQPAPAQRLIENIAAEDEERSVGPVAKPKTRKDLYSQMMVTSLLNPKNNYPKFGYYHSKYVVDV